MKANSFYKVETDNAPKAIGPYSQAIVSDNLIFCSGQIAINPINNEIIKGGIKEQTEQIINHLKNILISAGTDLAKVIRTEVFLKNMDDFKDMNEIYAKYFISDPKPARITVEVSRLPKDVSIEIGCIAIKE